MSVVLSLRDREADALYELLDGVYDAELRAVRAKLDRLWKPGAPGPIPGQTVIDERWGTTA